MRRRRAMRIRGVTLALDRLVDTVVLSCEVGWLKPEPAILEAALERLGVPPEKALLVDDLPSNLDAAASLGLQTVLMARPGGRSVPPRDGTAPTDGGGHTRVEGLAELWTLLG